MSPFLVYLMFQADGISALFGVLSLVLALAACIALAVATQGICSWENRDDVLAQKAIGSKVFKRTAPAAVVCFAAACLMPSTKTIAAMVVLPKLTSPAALDAMGNEAKELYGLAKDALRNLAGDEKNQPQH